MPVTNVGSRWNAGKLEWFDQITGGNIAVFDPATLTLQIPSGATLDVTGGTLSTTSGGIVTALAIYAGENLVEGDLVYVSGWNAASAAFVVNKADADAAGKLATLIMHGTVASGATGTAYRTHTLTALNTNAATAGDPVYLSATAGGWTLTAPTAANAIAQRVGNVSVKSATVGEIRFDLGLATVIKFGSNELQGLSVAESHLVAANADGLHPVRVARATYDFAVNGGAISAIDSGVTIPANAVILDGMVDVKTTCTTAGGDAGTMAISVEGANDIVAAIAVSNGGNPWDAGRHDVVPVGSAATAVKTTQARNVTFTIATQAFTAGKVHVFLRYVIGS
ncbi:MAG TPA: hypothetical protein VGK74_02710 [Symbiobacteriaceae bacterium]|jgi:hypothetical protein